MCDSDDPNDQNRSGMDLTGFLFGNIDESGQLEDDELLDGDSKRMLSSLNRLGLGSMLSEVLDQEEPTKEDVENGKPFSFNVDWYSLYSEILIIFKFTDYSEKSPSAVDFFDIDDVADEEKVNGKWLFYYKFLLLYSIVFFFLHAILILKIETYITWH